LPQAYAPPGSGVIYPQAPSPTLGMRCLRYGRGQGRDR